jgi:hypothetical protein
MLAELPGVDYVVGSYGGFFGTLEDAASGAWLLYSGNQGKRLGESRIFLGAEGSRGEPIHRLHYLIATYPDDPEMLEFLTEAAAQAARDRAEAATAKRAAVPSYVGAAACRSCHAEAHEQWASTPHAGAFAALEREGNQAKPDCVACHVTGAGAPGGFSDRQATPGLAAVSCEACHGPGGAHAVAPAKGYGPVGLATCTTCHDLENSPEFDYYSYRDRIVHRGGAAR